VCKQCLFYSVLTLTFFLGGGIPSLPFPFPLSSLPSFPPLPFKLAPSPYKQASIVARGVEGLGERTALPSGSAGVRPPNVFWCILGLNLHPFDCFMANNFPCLLSIKRKFPSRICNSLFRLKKRFIAHNLGAFWGNCKFWGGANSPPKMPIINTGVYVSRE